MNRRDVLAAFLALGAVLKPFDLFAQARSGQRPFRIGLPGSLAAPTARDLFVAGMSEFGWREKQDYVLLESGLPYEPVHVEEATRRIVAEKPDLIVVFDTAYAVAAHGLTKSIPIVMFGSGDPVLAGLANSLARPGKNVTGVSFYTDFSNWGKLLELLREAKPITKRVGVLWSYVPPAFRKEEIEPALGALRKFGGALGMATSVVQVSSEAGVQAALDAIDSGRPDAMIVTVGMSRWKAWSQIMQFAIDRKLPAITELPQGPGDKRPRPLLAYGPNLQSLTRARFSYIDRILRGANPGDLPIELPARIDLVVSLKTAKSLGLTLPQSLLLRANQVIE